MKNTIKKAIKVAGLNAEDFHITSSDFTTACEADAIAVIAELRKMCISISMETATRSRWDGPKDNFGAILGPTYIASPNMY